MVVHEPGEWFDETLASLASQDYPNVQSVFFVTSRVGEAGVDVARSEAVRMGAEQVLLTERGERVMLCGLGAGLGRFVFQPIQGLESFIPSEVRAAVRAWCPRAVVGQVAYAADPVAGVVAVGLTLRHNDAEQESLLQVAVRSA